MNNTLLDTVAACSKDLMKFGFSVEEFATLVQENNMTDAEVLAVAKVFEHLKAKKDSSTVDFLLRTSRLPLKVPKTFENFDFSRITGKNIDKLRNLSTLSALYAHKNLAFIGKPGTGKTHLAQAFGRACCEHGMKAYFIKMTELRDRMTDARRAGRESTLLAALVRPSCLIIDEVGHCEFDKESTRLFFDIHLPRRIAKSGFFPLEERHFTAITDDRHQLILRIEQQNDKAITTPARNSDLGEYFRNRLGLANGEYVSRDALDRYGRTDVTFIKLDEETYYMDFSV